MIMDLEAAETKHGEGTASTAWSHPSLSKPCVLEWHVMDYSVQKGKKRILSSIAGRAEGGEFLVIAGPSGCGKTSLVECLSLRNREWVGGVHLNGASLGGDYFTKSAVVYQQDMLFGFLTVREHLTFHATTRLTGPSSSSSSSSSSKAEAVRKRVEEVVEQLGLGKCADTVIGGTDITCMMKGISGGERKRTSIATELLLCPQILFLDEPTSGLDSVMSESVVESLSSVCKSQGSLIISSLHSPSSSLACHFTHVLLLTSDGRLAFQGRYDKALAYFHSIGLPAPSGFSCAEFLLHVVSHAQAGGGGGKGGATEGIITTDALVSLYQQSTYSIKQPLDKEDAHRHHKSVQGIKASYLTLWRLNCWRTLIRVQRETVAYATWMFIFGAVGLVFGLLFLHSATSSWRSMMGVITVSVSATLFITGLTQVIIFPDDWVKVVREHLSGANTVGAFIMSKLLYQACFLPGTVTMSTLIFWMAGIAGDGKTYLRFVATLVLECFAASNVGLLLASFANNPLIGVILVPAVFFPMLIFSGIFYERSTVPIYLQWIQATSIANHAISALLGYSAHALSKEDRSAVLAFCEVDPSQAPQHLLALVAITLAANLLAYLVLSLRLAMMKQIL